MHGGWFCPRGSVLFGYVKPFHAAAAKAAGALTLQTDAEA